MKKNLTNLLPLFFSMAFLFACQENTSTDAPLKVDNPSSSVSNPLPDRKVLPPLQGVDVPFQRFTVKTDQSQTIEVGNGTKINVPKAAFVDGNGNPLTGEVTLEYREFHDAATIIASGIPMQNATGDAYMETAGMFELQGSQSGNPISVAPNKRLEVQMGSRVAGDDFDFFFYNKKTCNWENQGTAKPEPNLAKIEKIKALKPLPSQPKQPQEYEKDAFVFDLDIDYKNFPELKAYHGIIWQYDGKNPATNPESNDWIFEENWTTIELQPLNSPTAYQLVLRNAQKVFKTEVTPALKGGNYEKAIAEFSRRNAEYQVLKEKRLVEESRLEAEANLLRSFEVSQFGIYNWDVWKKPNRVACVASFDFGSDQSGKIDNKNINIFLVTASNRSVVRYTHDTFDRFSFNPDEDNYMIAILPGNEVAIFTKEDFQKIDVNLLKNSKGKAFHTFKMKRSGDSIASLNDLSDLIQKLV